MPTLLLPQKKREKVLANIKEFSTSTFPSTATSSLSNDGCCGHMKVMLSQGIVGYRQHFLQATDHGPTDMAWTKSRSLRFQSSRPWVRRSEVAVVKGVPEVFSRELPPLQS